MQVLSGNCFAELEDATDGPSGMGQHPTPPRLERYGDGIPLTHPASGMGRGWEIDLYNWDGNGVGVAPPKPAPLPILLNSILERKTKLIPSVRRTNKLFLFFFHQLKYAIISTNYT